VLVSKDLDNIREIALCEYTELVTDETEVSEAALVRNVMYACQGAFDREPWRNPSCPAPPPLVVGRVGIGGRVGRCDLEALPCSAISEGTSTTLLLVAHSCVRLLCTIGFHLWSNFRWGHLDWMDDMELVHVVRILLSPPHWFCRIRRPGVGE
jgi:hypothetical protein